jgi:hypothetical protein
VEGHRAAGRAGVGDCDTHPGPGGREAGRMGVVVLSAEREEEPQFF